MCSVMTAENPYAKLFKGRGGDCPEISFEPVEPAVNYCQIVPKVQVVETTPNIYIPVTIPPIAAPCSCPNVNFTGDPATEGPPKVQFGIATSENCCDWDLNLNVEGFCHKPKIRGGEVFINMQGGNFSTTGSGGSHDHDYSYDYQRKQYYYPDKCDPENPQKRHYIDYVPDDNAISSGGGGSGKANASGGLRIAVVGDDPCDWDLDVSGNIDIQIPNFDFDFSCPEFGSGYAEIPIMYGDESAGSINMRWGAPGSDWGTDKDGNPIHNDTCHNSCGFDFEADGSVNIPKPPEPCTVSASGSATIDAGDYGSATLTLVSTEGEGDDGKCAINISLEGGGGFTFPSIEDLKDELKTCTPTFDSGGSIDMGDYGSIGYSVEETDGEDEEGNPTCNFSLNFDTDGFNPPCKPTVTGGGSVSLDAGGDLAGGASIELKVTPSDDGCSFGVALSGGGGFSVDLSKIKPPKMEFTTNTIEGPKDDCIEVPSKTTQLMLNGKVLFEQTTPEVRKPMECTSDVYSQEVGDQICIFENKHCLLCGVTKEDTTEQLYCFDKPKFKVDVKQGRIQYANGIFTDGICVGLAVGYADLEAWVSDDGTLNLSLTGDDVDPGPECFEGEQCPSLE